MNIQTIRSFVRVFSCELAAAGAVISEGSIDEITDILAWKVAAMPLVMRTAIIFLTGFFNWMGIFYTGRSFSQQDLRQQQRTVERGSRMSLALVRELVRFYQKMTFFIYYSLQEEKAA